MKSVAVFAKSRQKDDYFLHKLSTQRAVSQNIGDKLHTFPESVCENFEIESPN
jgi:hypothetical protein